MSVSGKPDDPAGIATGATLTICGEATFRFTVFEVCPLVVTVSGKLPAEITWPDGTLTAKITEQLLPPGHGGTCVPRTVSGVPFRLTVDDPFIFVPEIESTKSLLPTGTVAGEIAVTCGIGL